jgi:hypothetical protein
MTGYNFMEGAETDVGYYKDKIFIRGKTRVASGIGLIGLTFRFVFHEKMAPNDDRFSRKNVEIIAIIVILRKTKFW